MPASVVYSSFEPLIPTMGRAVKLILWKLICGYRAFVFQIHGILGSAHDVWALVANPCKNGYGLPQRFTKNDRKE